MPKRYGLPVAFKRRHFRRHAKKVEVQLDGGYVGVAHPRENKTGSLGWRLDARMQVRLGDHVVWVQLAVQMVICASKTLPAEPSDPDVSEPICQVVPATKHPGEPPDADVA